MSNHSLTIQPLFDNTHEYIRSDYLIIQAAYYSLGFKSYVTSTSPTSPKGADLGILIPFSLASFLIELITASASTSSESSIADLNPFMN